MSRYANIFLKIRNADHVADILGVDPSYLRFIVLSPRYRHFRIRKASGGTRLIEAPDRVHKLPVGAPTSPVISNFVMLNLDLKLSGLSEEYDYVYTRYADDLTFSGDSKPGKEFLAKLKRIIESEGFRVNENKFRIRSDKSRQMVTGITVNEKV